MPPDHLNMCDDHSDSENTPLFEAVATDGPTPMEGVITVADSPAASPALGDTAVIDLEAGEDDSKGTYTVRTWPTVDLGSRG
jgi:hypothetical protein